MSLSKQTFMLHLWSGHRKYNMIASNVLMFTVFRWVMYEGALTKGLWIADQSARSD